MPKSVFDFGSIPPNPIGKEVREGDKTGLSCLYLVASPCKCFRSKADTYATTLSLTSIAHLLNPASAHMTTK
jgi:hypothetical protein